MNTQSGNAHLHNMWGEIALITAVTINSFGVVLMLYSAAGISAISSVPYAFSLVLPRLTLGTWTYIFQGALILTLMIMRRKFVPQYLCSFIVGFVFGKMLDIHEMWIGVLPTALPWRVLYFVISYLLICIGIALSNRCGLPIIPSVGATCAPAGQRRPAALLQAAPGVELPAAQVHVRVARRPVAAAATLDVVDERATAGVRLARRAGVRRGPGSEPVAGGADLEDVVQAAPGGVTVVGAGPTGLTMAAELAPSRSCMPAR